MKTYQAIARLRQGEKFVEPGTTFQANFEPIEEKALLAVGAILPLTQDVSSLELSVDNGETWQDVTGEKNTLTGDEKKPKPDKSAKKGGDS